MGWASIIGDEDGRARWNVNSKSAKFMRLFQQWEAEFAAFTYPYAAAAVAHAANDPEPAIKAATGCNMSAFAKTCVCNSVGCVGTDFGPSHK